MRGRRPAWREKRRPEPLKFVEENQYGRVPPRPPALATPMMNHLGDLMHDGPHAVLPADWTVFLDFMDAHLKAAN
jgi:hypothetical protein